jgi:hypothetical protein
MLFTLVACAGLWTANGYIAPTSLFNASSNASTWSTKLKAVFWNFDATIPVSSVGGWILSQCGGGDAANFVDACCKVANNCTAYNTTEPGYTVSCPCFADDNAFANYYKANYANSGNITDSRDFNGTDRLQRFNQTLALLAANGVANKVASTAWFYLTPAAWTNFLDAYFTTAGINMFLNASTIYAIADPGCGIHGNKSVPISTYLGANGWKPSQGVLVDGSAGNIGLLNGASDWLQPIPKAGVALDQLQWLEARAQYTPPSPSMPPSSATVTVPALSALVAWVFM